MNSYSLALSTAVHRQAADHLLRADGQEDLCFAIWHQSRGRDRTTALLHSLVLPKEGEREVHGNVSFLPAYFERALGAAIEAGGGLALLHSHPGGQGWQGMSSDDVRAEQGTAAAARGATGLPLVGLTMGSDEALSARFWEKVAPRSYERRWCESTRVVGERLSVAYCDELRPPPTFRPQLTRTVSAWGPQHQRNLARLRIGVVGTGSVGSMVGEALARTGFADIRLLDFDGVEVINLDRLLHAFPRDARLRRAKTEVLAKAMRRSATASRFKVEALEWSIVEEEGFRAALDCDVLFSCVDRPWPRSVLNFIAYTHLIPVVDGGIIATANRSGNGMRGADWRAHIAAPERRCLECLGQYDPGLVATERDGYLDNPAYIAGLPADHQLRRNENVFAFSMSLAGFEMLQLLAMVVAPAGLPNPGAQMYHFATGHLDVDERGCDEHCIFTGLVARGDSSCLTLTGRHAVAEAAREARRRFQRHWWYPLHSLGTWAQEQLPFLGRD